MNELVLELNRRYVDLDLRKKLYLFFKRVFDFVVSGISMIILLPLFYPRFIFSLATKLQM